jgi:glutathione S-transferase
MITVHHLNNSRSQRVLWLLEELGCAYEVIRYERDPQTMLAPRELRKVHPLGKSPVVTDGDKTLAESGAIIEYLVDTYDDDLRLAPARGTPERLRYTYWLHYAEGSAMSPLLLKLIFARMPKGPMPFFLRPIVRGICAKAQARFVDPQLALHVEYWESELSKHPWFVAEEFTAADIQMSFPVEIAEARIGLGARRARLSAFLERIRARPAYQRALAKGGPFQIAGGVIAKDPP